ncbi:MAG: SMP-30/gluconolactonase/LRE family protein [Alphaproteobacteria bacterium]
MRPELIADACCATGESPLWHPGEACVYWLDIPAGKMFRYDPGDGRYETVYDGFVTGGLTVQADGGLLMFMAQGAVATWRGGALTAGIQARYGEIGYRFNDVIADPEGRVYCGVMAYDGPSIGRRNRAGAILPAKIVRRLARIGRRALRRGSVVGKLSLLESSGAMRTALEVLDRPNGMGFTPDRSGLYVTSSGARTIRLYDYDAGTGGLANPRLFAKIPEGRGTPDGLAVDAEGCVWSALWGGGALLRFSPEGRIEREIAMPTQKVSNLVFGGDRLTDIYVTTAGGLDRGQHDPLAGGLFHIDIGIPGLPAFRSDVTFASDAD